MDLGNLIKTLIVGGMFLLAFLNFSNALRVNKKANIWFGFFVLIWSSFWLDEMIYPAQTFPSDSIFFSLRFLQFMVPLVFLGSVVFYTNPHYKFKSRDLLFLVLPVIFLSVMFLGKDHEFKGYKTILMGLFFTQALACNVLAYFKVQKHQKVIESFSSNTYNIDLSWIKYIIYFCLLCSVFFLMLNLIYPDRDLNSLTNLFFLFILYLVTFYSIRQVEIFPVGLKLEETLESASSISSENSDAKVKLMSDKELLEAKSRLAKLMESEEVYLDSELNLVKLAQRMNLNSHQLSYIINSGFEVNFFQYINAYRVEKAKKLLVDPDMEAYNMVSIGFASGFNSKTAFNTVFKNMTGQTPSEFRQSKS
ncbi:MULTISPECIES: helix-turn-helix domain-containing protein [Sphingobacterium]|uniref:HTH araC/xylS-type domain-containing protein n=1 Tax=Sphingobacterium cellulitidis TaxID=1768011 RepID=A0A8H9FY72_9SPHI|nr:MULTISPECIES: helix-turn-helix domain-containing protein [Sphingobacterium]MBA8986840.1 AraC-like DNA-binding protein [Sphingobacterium soli]WFB64948.1 helix-turn-helix domain-containing protein [Sphingobacterium sp. WM]GGE14387.1 hypothetical protein GCM10011516_10210 [Sphingobacterium soli]